MRSGGFSVTAGPAVLNVAITPVAADGSPVTAWGHPHRGADPRLRYRIEYSCLVAACTDTTVTLPGANYDPTYATFRLLNPVVAEWTAPPVAGATISGNVSGVTIDLGTLPAGSSGTFTVPYAVNLARADTGGTIHNRVYHPAFFPDGYQIEVDARIESPDAGGPVTASASPVTWSVPVPAGPGIVVDSPGTVRPDEDVTFAIRMSNGCARRAGSGHINFPGWAECSKDWTVRYFLPAEAEFVSASDTHTYDPGTHSITWSLSGQRAIVGWGHTGSGWSATYDNEAHPRTVTVRFPEDRFPGGAGGGDIVATVQHRATVDMTYIGGSAASGAHTRAHDVVRIAPFARADFSAKDSLSNGSDGQVRLVRVAPDTTGMICPPEARDEWGRACTPGNALAAYPEQQYYWEHLSYNQSNVPAVAIVEDDLAHAGTQVTRIYTLPVGAAVEYELDNGATGNGVTASNGFLDAPAGRHFVWARITSPELASGRERPTDTTSTPFRVRFYYVVKRDAPIGEERTNTIDARLTFPDHPGLTDLDNATDANQQYRTIRFVEVPPVAPPAPPKPAFTASVPAPVVAGGGLAVPGRAVTWSTGGATANIPADRDITPQYVFVAPAGWTILRDSNPTFAASVPAGVSFEYRTVTIAGIAREAVEASWPSTTVFGENGAFPAMSVVTTPTYAVPAGTVSTATGYITDARHTWTNTEATYAGAAQDAPDIDGDSVATEWWSSASRGSTVGSVSALSATKEICQAASDGSCTWVSDPDILVGVDPGATAIRYRITLQNTGNSGLSNVVGYDILPHPGDTGTSQSAAGSPRGSTIALTLTGVSDVASSLALTYSTSTNPCRDEVFPSSPGCVNDWGGSSGGARAIRMAAIGTLAPGDRLSFEYTAAIEGGAQADQIACNSVAVDSGSTLPTEPRNVCATTQAADLVLDVPERLPLQSGRPGVIPFSVLHDDGSPTTPATITIDLPFGLTVTDLTPPGWRCEPAGTHPTGTATGPDNLTCVAVDPDGTLRHLALDVPETLTLAIVPDEALIGGTVCVDGLIAGPMFDPEPANNDAQGCFEVAASVPAIGIAKTDGETVALVGDQLTYAITVSNALVGEAVADLHVIDTLPSSLRFISASHGGTPSDPTQPGGTVTWTLDELTAAAVANPDGSVGTPAPGSTITLTLTVEVVTDSTGEIENVVTVNAPDPADPTADLCPDPGCSASDVDAHLSAVVHYEKTATPAVTEVLPGDEVTYTVIVSNAGDIALTHLSFTDDLTDVLGDATYNGDVQVVSGPGTASFDGGDTISWTMADGEELAVGAEARIAYSITVNGAISSDGVMSNRVVGTGPNSNCLAGSTDPDCVEQSPLPVLVSSKSISDPTPEAGQQIVYEFTISNEGSVPGYALEVIDDLTGVVDDAVRVGDPVVIGPGSVTVDDATHRLTWTGDLAPDGSVTVRYPVDVDAARALGDGILVNALIGYDCPDPADTTTPSDCVTITPISAWEATKSVSATDTVVPGEALEYQIVIANLGQTPLTALAISDDLAGVLDDASIVPGGSPSADIGSATMHGTSLEWGGDLGIGQAATITYRVEVNGADALTDGVLINAVSGSPNCPATDCATRTLVEAVVVTKTATPAGPVEAGDQVRYELTIDNVGGADQTGIAVNDDLSGVLDDASLDAEPSLTGSGTLEYLDAMLTWTGDLIADSSATITYTVTVDDPSPAGDGTLVNAAVGGLNCTDPAVIDPSDGEFEPACVTRTHVAEWFVTKSTDVAGAAQPGDLVGYTIRVDNTGGIDLASVSIDDVLTGVLDDAIMEIDPSASSGAVAAHPDGIAWSGAIPVDDAVTITYAVRIDAAEALGDAVLVNEVVDAPNCPSAACETETPIAALGLAKAADPTSVNAIGTPIAYEFVVTNFGSVELTDLAIEDILTPPAGPSPIVSCPQTTLAPAGSGGDSTTCSGTYAASATDFDAGSIHNTATASALAPSGETITSTPATATVATEPTPGLALLKSAAVVDTDPDGVVGLGDEVVWSFQVRNTGNVTLTDVLVHDPGAGTVTCPADAVAADTTITCTADRPRVITQADVDAGRIDNEATASATCQMTSCGTVHSDVASATVPINAEASVRLAKTGHGIDVDADEVISVGDRVAWTFRVTNDGPVALADIAVLDPMAGHVACPSDVLGPGEAMTCTSAAQLVTMADADRGRIVNTASVTASGVGGAGAVMSVQAHAVVAVEAWDGLDPPDTSSAWAAPGVLAPGTMPLLALVGMAAITAFVVARRERDPADRRRRRIGR